MGNTLSIYNLFFYFIIYASLGWILEVCYAYFKHRKFVNRGFLHGPFCPIYGVGVVSVFYIVEYTTRAFSNLGSVPIWQVFIITTIVTTILEWITGDIMYRIFKTRWWDYSKRKFNINGYVCLSFSLIWGVVGTVVLMNFHTKVIDVVGSILIETGQAILIGFVLYFIIDGALTVIALINFKKLLVEFEESTKEYAKLKKGLLNELQETAEELSKNVKDEIERKSGEGYKAFERLQQHIKELQTAERIPYTKIGGILHDLKEQNKKFNIRPKFDIKNKLDIINIIKQYEIKNKTLKASRLYKAFPSLGKSIYKKQLENLKYRSMNVREGFRNRINKKD